MAERTITKSMRLTQEIIDIIEEQPGDTFTNKFEGLVRKCVLELPIKEKQLRGIQEEIQKERENLRTVQRAKATFAQNLNNLEWSMKNLERQVNQAAKVIEGI